MRRRSGTAGRRRRLVIDLSSAGENPEFASVRIVNPMRLRIGSVADVPMMKERQ
jgi:hypothetical protein